MSGTGTQASCWQQRPGMVVGMAMTPSGLLYPFATHERLVPETSEGPDPRHIPANALIIPAKIDRKRA